MCGIPYREMEFSDFFQTGAVQHQEVLAYELIVWQRIALGMPSQVQAVRIKLNLFGDLHSQDAWPEYKPQPLDRKP